jgi:hypothetical protein
VDEGVTMLMEEVDGDIEGRMAVITREGRIN